jgi:AcrR family transcriptional regulator
MALAERRRFVRAGEEARREALIEATLALVAAGGVEAATVRAIAARAGVTPGLIRHYFQTKEALLAEAFGALMGRMIAAADQRAQPAGDPRDRLARFVVASLRPPVMSAEQVGLWAGFLHRVQADPDLRRSHDESYRGYRDRLEALIAAALPGVNDPARLRALAIACNAVIDGLWLEGSLLPESFAAGEIEAIGLAAVGAILGLSLPEVP